jgi:hypothetical protein
VLFCGSGILPRPAGARGPKGRTWKVPSVSGVGAGPAPARLRSCCHSEARRAEESRRRLRKYPALTPLLIAIGDFEEPSPRGMMSAGEGSFLRATAA